MTKIISNADRRVNSHTGLTKVVKLEIIIEGTVIHHFKDFHLHQSIKRHHDFELVLAHDALDQAQNHELRDAHTFLGKRITVVFSYRETVPENPQRSFVGVITKVAFSQKNTSLGDIVLSGFSPTILIDSAPHFQSFGGKEPVNTAFIAKQIIKQGIDGSKFDIRIDARNRSYIPYSAQYNETHYNYLARMAEAYGEAFYYDGEILHFGNLPPHEKPFTLAYGHTVREVKVELNAVFTKSRYFGYNSSAHHEMSGIDQPVRQTGSLSEASYQLSEKIYSTQSLTPVPVNANIDLDVDQSQASRRGSAATEVFTVSGDTSLPFLYPGCVADIEMREFKTGRMSYFTRVMVTEISHSVDALGNYTGHFHAISEGTGHIPKPDFRTPFAGPQLATVISNADPLNQGRVQVRFQWQAGEQTHFIRVMSPDAGGTDAVQQNRGFVAIPEIGDQVMIDFEYGNPDFPFVMGSMFHGKNALGGGIKNHLKSIQTKSGIRVLMNDLQKSVTIEDPSGNTYFMDGQGNISITAPKSMKFSAGEDIEMNAGKNLEVKVGNSMEFMSANLASFHMVSGALFSAPLMEMSVPLHLNIQTGKTSMLSEEETNIQGKTTHVAGMEKLMIHSEKETFVNSKGKTNVLGKDGNHLSNIPRDYNPLEKKMDGNCLVHFRPKPQWKGNGYGFDWVRAGDTALPGDSDYAKIIGRSVYNHTLFTLDASRYPDLIASFSHYTYTHTDEAGNRSKQSYAAPYLTLYPGASATLDVFINNREAPTSIELEYDHSKFQITHDPFVLTKGNHEINLTITCINEFSRDRSVKVIATYPGRLGNRKRTAGALQVKANHRTYEVPVVFIDVITNIGHGRRSVFHNTEDEKLRVTNLLKQSYITPVFREPITLDLSGDPEQGSGIIHNGKEFFNGLFNTVRKQAYRVGLVTHPTTQVIQARDFEEVGSITRKMRDFLEMQLKISHPNEDYRSVKKVFFINQRLTIEEPFIIVNGITPHADNHRQPMDNVLMFAGYKHEDIAHELMHSLGLPHTFDGESRFMFEKGSTDNIMDYPELPIKPISTYHWQWAVLQKNARPVR